MATGAWTPNALPLTQPFFALPDIRFSHLTPSNPNFSRRNVPSLRCGYIANWFYGFPINRDGVVKVANQRTGPRNVPDSPERAVTADEEKRMREFLSETFPALADAPIVYTRICLYVDTNDGVSGCADHGSTRTSYCRG